MSEPANLLDAALYEPLTPDQPCGEDLPREAFVELNELCSGKPGEYDYLEQKEKPPTPPDFAAAQPVAIALLKRSRDVRPLARLVQIESNLRGAAGLHASLHLLDKAFEDHWDGMYPGPADDTGALNARRQALNAALDHRKITSGIEQIALFNGPGNEGPIRLRDIKIALGTTRARDDELTRDETALAELVAAVEGGEKIKAAQEALTGAAEISRSLGNRFAERRRHFSTRALNGP